MNKLSTNTCYYLEGRYKSINLTYWEMQCARYMVRGETEKKIAIYLKLSPSTLFFYLNNLMIKFECVNKKDLVESLQESSFIFGMEDLTIEPL